MESAKDLPAQQTAEQDDLYFHLMSTIGMTKHAGGTFATDLLVEQGHFKAGDRLLDVGCGVGFTEFYLVREHGLYAVGVDVRPAMIERAREYAQAQGFSEEQVSFRVADAQELPFEDNTFDGVICESVLVFVPDKLRALREFVRVTRPGGYVGFTESIWLGTSSEQLRDFLSACAGPQTSMELSSTWEQLLTDSGLIDTVARTFDLNLMRDARDQVRRIGLARILKFWGRTLKLIIQQPRYRKFLSTAMKTPVEAISKMGYGVYMGRKPR